MNNWIVAMVVLCGAMAVVKLLPSHCESDFTVAHRVCSSQLHNQFASWPIFQTTPRALASRLASSSSPSILVKRSTSRFFMYHDDALEGLISNTPDLQEVEVIKISPSEFVDVACGEESSSSSSSSSFYYYYYTTMIDPVKEGYVYRDMPHWQSIYTDYVLRDPIVNLWMGGAGVSTQIHFDTSDNIFVQVYGRKRFLLFPPEEHANLRLYPELHTRARKSQLPVGDRAWNSKHYPNLITPIEIVLEPRDVLFLPAYWFHQVEALDCSISLNFFGLSSNEEIVSELLRLPLPIDSKNMMSAHHFLTQLVEALGFDFAILLHWLQERYAAIETNCTTLDSEERTPLTDFARKLAPFLHLFGRIGSIGVKEIVLLNYIEIMISNFVTHDCVKDYVQLMLLEMK